MRQTSAFFFQQTSAKCKAARMHASACKLQFSISHDFGREMACVIADLSEFFYNYLSISLALIISALGEYLSISLARIIE
jgi:hypothetical protein